MDQLLRAIREFQTLRNNVSELDYAMSFMRVMIRVSMIMEEAMYEHRHSRDTNYFYSQIYDSMSVLRENLVSYMQAIYMSEVERLNERREN